MKIEQQVKQRQVINVSMSGEDFDELCDFVEFEIVDKLLDKQRNLELKFNPESYEGPLEIAFKSIYQKLRKHGHTPQQADELLTLVERIYDLKASHESGNAVH